MPTIVLCGRPECEWVGVFDAAAEQDTWTCKLCRGPAHPIGVGELAMLANLRKDQINTLTRVYQIMEHGGKTPISPPSDFTAERVQAMLEQADLHSAALSVVPVDDPLAVADVVMTGTQFWLGRFTHVEYATFFAAAPAALAWCLKTVDNLRHLNDTWERAYDKIAAENEQLRSRPGLTPAPAYGRGDREMQLYLTALDKRYDALRLCCVDAKNLDRHAFTTIKAIDHLLEAVEAVFRYKNVQAEIEKLEAANSGETSPKQDAP